MNLIVSSPFEVIVIRIQSIRKPDCHADFAQYESSWPPPSFCCSLVSHSNKSVKKPLTFSSIARASSSDSRWALRGCQTSSVRSIRLSSDFSIRNHRLLQRRPGLRRVRDRSAAADDRRVQSLPKTDRVNSLSLKNQVAEIDFRVFNLRLGG